MRSDRTLYLDDSRTRMVERNDPRRRHILSPRGHVIDDATALRLGLYLDADKKVRQKKKATQEGPSYKDLQEEAKALGLNSAGVHKDDLERQIQEAIQRQDDA